MKRRLQISVRVVWMFFVIGLTASLAIAAHEVKTVPIKGHFTGTVTVTTLSASNATYQVDSVGHGNVSHLGRSTAAWRIPEVQVDLSNQVLIVSNTTWTGVITAANGDQIVGVYTFPTNVIPFTITGDVNFEAPLQITGGTGRFQYATGSANSAGTANIFTGHFDIRFNGRISSVGSSKPPHP